MDNVIPVIREIPWTVAETGWIDLRVGCPAVDETSRHLEAIDQTPEAARAGWLAACHRRFPVRREELER